MLSVRLEPEIEQRLTALAKRTGRTMTFYVREMILENIEDFEDRYIAEARLEKRAKPLSSEEAWKELGLDD